MSEASKFNGIIHLAGQVADDDKQDITGQTKQVLAQGEQPMCPRTLSSAQGWARRAGCRRRRREVVARATF
jgi:hypothetical protein